MRVQRIRPAIAVKSLLRHHHIYHSGGCTISGKPTKSLKRLFIISPIGDVGSETREYFNKVRRHIIEPVASDKGYETSRSDNISQPGRITTQIIERLREDDLVIADLTQKNPNVFYELAVRHAVGKPVILMGAIGDTIPFDLAAQRVIFYNLDPDNIVEARKELARQISSVESRKFVVDSPIESSITLERPKTDNDKQERIEAILENLSIQLRRIETRERQPQLSGEVPAAIWADIGQSKSPQIFKVALDWVMAEGRALKSQVYQEMRKNTSGVEYRSFEAFRGALKKAQGSTGKPIMLSYDGNELVIWFIRDGTFVAWKHS